jgi:hypothetical protein
VHWTLRLPGSTTHCKLTEPSERAYLDNLGRLIEARFAGKPVGDAVVAMLPSGALVARAMREAAQASMAGKGRQSPDL